jgi:alcohol dehydrogenase class IV
MYEFSLPTRVVVETGGAERIAEEISRCRGVFPSNVLVVTPGEGWSAAHINGMKDRLLGGGSKRVAIFDKVLPNPDRTCVKKCVDISRSSGSDAIIAFGGGSSMDVAKTAADESGVGFLVTIPTTAGTGSEVSPWAVITNEITQEKESRIAKLPDLAILDPVLTVSMPPLLTLFSGIDAFSHGLEAYVSKSQNAVTDALSLHAIQMIAGNLKAAVSDGTDTIVRSRMLEGSLLAGIAMLYSGLGLIHAVANTIGGMHHDFPHGLIISYLLKEVLQFNRPAISKHKYDEVQQQMGEILSAVEIVQIPEVEVRAKDIPLIVERGERNINALTNPRNLSHADIERIVRRSFKIIL